MRHTLICTVGTSLFNNIKRLEADAPIRQALDAKNWTQVSLLLLKEDNTNRLCGAEINSITSICNEGSIEQRLRLIFLVSDTEDGKDTGQVLKQYYSHSRNTLKFEETDSRTLIGLRDSSVQDFQQQGLKNLVREISSEARNYGAESIAINATGGYKAQISFAGMIGQALEMPVYYLFEKFSKVIVLPPQPVSLDLSLWISHHILFENLEDSEIMDKSLSETDISDEYLQPLLEEESIDGVSYVTLSAMGELFHQRCRLQFYKQETTELSLIPKDETEPERKQITLSGDHHGNDELEKFAKKLCRSPFVREVVNSLQYNSYQRYPIRRAKADGIVDFVLTWTDKGLGLCVQTTGRNQTETNTIALHLVKKFAK